MPVTSVREFLRLIEKSSLLSSEQLAEFKTWPEEEPATLVARMVKAGWITDWQSQQLQAGKSQFFMGRYKLLDLIGVGGMGAVFMAMLPPYGRTVALKVMSKQLLKQPKSVTRFLREIRSAAAVDHPNLVRAYDADCDRDTYFLVMEFVSGRNLKSWIKTEKSLPIGWSCECIRQAALGLEHAFEQGMVHRDIKPSNLLVSEDAHDGLPLVKILDLGLARFVSETEDTGDLTRSGQVLGTPDYIAPEQARNTKMADIRADIFSLGCTLFELLTGRLPFPGETVMEKLMARASQDAYHVRLYRPDVPVELDAIVAKMLARDPQMRFGTPAEVAQALAPFAIGTSGDIPVTAPSSSPASPSTAGPAAKTFAPLDVTTDTSLHGFPVDLTQATGERTTRRQARPPTGLWWGQPRVRVAAASMAAVVVLLLAGTLLSGKKGPPSDDSSHEARPSKKHKKEPPNGKEGRAIELTSDEEVDPERATAKWVLKQGGSLIVIAHPHAGTHRQKQSSGKTGEPAAESRELHAPVELPAGAIQITGVELHGQIQLSKLDMGRLANLTRLESLNLADTRIINADLAPLQDARALTHLDLQDTPTTDAGVAFLKRMPNLQSLRLSRTRISGAALETLKSLRSLTELHLEGTRIRDADLRHLRGMPQLVTLNLARTEVKGAWDNKVPSLHNVWQLRELTTLDLSGLHLVPNALNVPRRTDVPLRSLRLTSSRINDDGLKQLSGMNSLRELWLGSTAVTGEGLKQLTWMTNLEHLGLEDTVVDDLGLKELGGLKSLKSLNLQGTVVSDAGLIRLQGLKDLRSLDVSGTKVTEDGIKALRQELPSCAIEF